MIIGCFMTASHTWLTMWSWKIEWGTVIVKVKWIFGGKYEKRCLRRDRNSALIIRNISQIWLCPGMDSTMWSRMGHLQWNMSYRCGEGEEGGDREGGSSSVRPGLRGLCVHLQKSGYILCKGSLEASPGPGKMYPDQSREDAGWAGAWTASWGEWEDGKPSPRLTCQLKQGIRLIIRLIWLTSFVFKYFFYRIFNDNIWHF